MLLVFLAWLIPAAGFARAEAPQFNLAEIGDPTLDGDLQRAFNLPLMARSWPDLSDGAWRQKAETERLRLAGILRGSGHLDGDVKLLEGIEGKAALTFKPEPGPLYRIGSVEVGGISPDVATSLKEQIYFQMRAVTGRVGRGDILARLEGEILWLLKTSSYASSRISERRITTDSRNNLAVIFIKVELGPSSRFGETRYRGLRQLLREDLTALQPYKIDESFDWAKLDQFYATLITLPLVRHAKIFTTETTQEGRVSIGVDIEEQQGQVSGRGPPESYVLLWLVAALSALMMCEMVLVSRPGSSAGASIARGLTVIAALGLAGAFTLLCIRLFALATAH
jgi:hypothetical protein